MAREQGDTRHKGAKTERKTTLLMKIRELLEANGIEDVSYIDFEDDIVRLKFERDPKEFIKFHIASGRRHYFLMDEVQYVRDIGRKLKVIFDTFDNVKMILTGLSSFDLTRANIWLGGLCFLTFIHSIFWSF